MSSWLSSSNVFVSASAIENLFNFVGEAMLLGCPVVSFCVGGVPDMLAHGLEGFLIRLDPYVPFTMGPLLILVLSFAFAWVWDWLVTDRVTRWLRSFWGR